MDLRSRRLWGLIGLVWVLGWAAPVQAQNFDLEGWLDEPDVKLVAVEFYADWCEPCKEAAPKWEKLRKKYADQGLKLVVVNMDSASRDKRCSQLPWRPDESLCDKAIGERLGVKNLPEAFVWSWQGNLLVERGEHVDEIDRVIRRYLKDNPRVQVRAKSLNGEADQGLRRQVEEELGDSGKLTIVPDDEMRKRLAAVRKESQDPTRRDDQRCALGAEVSANSILEVERFEGAIGLTLVDAVTGCQRATVSAPWKQTRSGRSIKTVTHKLMKKLKRPQVEMPTVRRASGPGPTADREQEEELQTSGAALNEVRRTEKGDESWFTADEDHLLTLDMGELNCAVSIDGDLRPGKKSFLLGPGEHVVRAECEMHLPWERRLRLKENLNLRVEPEPNVGDLAVSSSPEGATVLIDGENVGRTPYGTKLEPGTYRVELRKEMYVSWFKQVRVLRGDSKTVNRELKPTFGIVNFITRPPGAEVLVDHKPLVGKTPLTKQRIPVGPHSVKLTAPDHHPVVIQNFMVKPGAERTVDETLSPQLGALVIRAVADDGQPVAARVFIDKKEQEGGTPYKGKLRVGEYEVRVVHEGVAETKTVFINARETETLNVDLDPIRAREEARRAEEEKRAKRREYDRKQAMAKRERREAERERRARQERERKKAQLARADRERSARREKTWTLRHWSGWRLGTPANALVVLLPHLHMTSVRDENDRFFRRVHLGTVMPGHVGASYAWRHVRVTGELGGGTLGLHWSHRPSGFDDDGGHELGVVSGLVVGAGIEFRVADSGVLGRTSIEIHGRISPEFYLDETDDHLSDGHSHPHEAISSAPPDGGSSELDPSAITTETLIGVNHRVGGWLTVTPEIRHVRTIFKEHSYFSMGDGGDGETGFSVLFGGLALELDAVALGPKPRKDGHGFLTIKIHYDHGLHSFSGGVEPEFHLGLSMRIN